MPKFRLFALFIPACVALASGPATAASVTIDSQAVDVYPAPIVQAGRVFVPLRGIFEALGASVVYQNGSINATRGDTTVSLQIGSTDATVSGSPQTIDSAPFIVGESTYVPLRFIAQSLGDQVSYDNGSSTVEITQGNNQGSNDEQSVAITQPPPPMPIYEQPPCPEPNDLWVPGYWSWGNAGYYWVPGTWAQPPAVGLLWTPGYWGWNNGSYGFHQGYWGPHVGFYGGINYGFGYIGSGFFGGLWVGNAFRYNTAFSHVNENVIRNVYVNRTVVINNRTINVTNTTYVNNSTHVSYNGGPHGVAVRPTESELSAVHERHVPPTVVQLQHQRAAAQNRNYLAVVNHGKPTEAAIVRPLSASHRPANFAPVLPADTATVHHRLPPTIKQETITPSQVRTIRPRVIAPAPRPRAMHEPRITHSTPVAPPQAMREPHATQVHAAATHPHAMHQPRSPHPAHPHSPHPHAPHPTQETHKERPH